MTKTNNNSKALEARHSDSSSVDEVLSWVNKKNSDLKVVIQRSRLSSSTAWFYDEEKGEIRNKSSSFFQIRGLQQYENGELVLEQPILIQDEIGYLGIICRKFNDAVRFLMQAKIEPGNVNKIQISPTIQATKSNFTQMHGGKKPAYLDYFLNADKYNILFDQIQSEQSSRFLGKRNRNIMIMVDEDVEALPSHMWLTMEQIKQLMKIDNLVNMDTRTVLSCIPCSCFEQIGNTNGLLQSKAVYDSVFGENDRSDFVKVYRYINDYKMFHKRENKIVPLTELSSWSFTDTEIAHKESYPFKVIFCDIEIEGREVTHWTQPLFAANGTALFGLIMSEKDGKMKFLVHALPEAGCFDGIELAPSVQLEADCAKEKYDKIADVFFKKLASGSGVKTDVILSEEGGRFYQEQNRNIIIEIPFNEIIPPPDGYFWLDFKTLNQMAQYNNVLNIQLRNLLSLLEF